MAYSDFTLNELKSKFQLVVDEKTDLFADVAEVELPDTLAVLLRRYLPLARNLTTEKARSELVISPVLMEFKLLHDDRISLFSGLEFNVDDAAGLRGRCDYILSENAEQLVLTAPVCVLVEAKNENIVAGVPQCLAEMVAALRFNAAQELPSRPVFGAVTTGMLWRFLKLDGLQAFIDLNEYSIREPKKIFGILHHIALGQHA